MRLFERAEREHAMGRSISHDEKVAWLIAAIWCLVSAVLFSLPPMLGRVAPAGHPLPSLSMTSGRAYACLAFVVGIFFCRRHRGSSESSHGLNIAYLILAGIMTMLLAVMEWGGAISYLVGNAQLVQAVIGLPIAALHYRFGLAECLLWAAAAFCLGRCSLGSLSPALLMCRLRGIGSLNERAGRALYASIGISAFLFGLVASPAWASSFPLAGFLDVMNGDVRLHGAGSLGIETFVPLILCAAGSISALFVLASCRPLWGSALLADKGHGDRDEERLQMALAATLTLPCIGELTFRLLSWGIPGFMSVLSGYSLALATVQALCVLIPLLVALPLRLPRVAELLGVRGTLSAKAESDADPTNHLVDSGTWDDVEQIAGSLSDEARERLRSSSLTKRETEVVCCSLAGLSSSHQAELLGIAASTVRNYSQRAYRKLGVASVRELREQLGEIRPIGLPTELSEPAESAAVRMRVIVGALRFATAIAALSMSCIFSESWLVRQSTVAIAFTLVLVLETVEWWGKPIREPQQLRKGGGDGLGEMLIVDWAMSKGNVSVRNLPMLVAGLLWEEGWRKSAWPYYSLSDAFVVCAFLLVISTYVTNRNACVAARRHWLLLPFSSFVLSPWLGIEASLCICLVSQQIITYLLIVLMQRETGHGGPDGADEGLLAAGVPYGAVVLKLSHWAKLALVGAFAGMVLGNYVGDALMAVFRSHWGALYILELERSAAIATLLPSFVIGFLYAAEMRSELASERLSDALVTREDARRKIEGYLVGRGLSDVQVQVVFCLAEGMTKNETARFLNYAPSTIAAARSEAYRVLGVTTRLGLVRCVATVIEQG